MKVARNASSLTRALLAVESSSITGSLFVSSQAVLLNCQNGTVDNPNSIPTEIADLRGKRLVFVNETNESARLDVAKIKALAGGDTLPARHLYQDHFTFEPTTGYSMPTFEASSRWGCESI
jgi:hypothetical protein